MFDHRVSVPASELRPVAVSCQPLFHIEDTIMTIGVKKNRWVEDWMAANIMIVCFFTLLKRLSTF